MKKNVFILTSLVVLFFASCNSNKNEESSQKIQFDLLQDTIALKVKATEEKYKAMTIEQLILELENSALKGGETFNSAAFREIITRKGAAQPLFASIKDSSQKEYFKLMALKKLDENLYNRIPPNISVAILTDALEKSVTFNGWGIPDHYWESSAKALIDFGNSAKPYLVELLDNKREAPVWGSEEAMLYERYKYRVCDYALAMLYAIDKDKASLPTSPEERDGMIKKYRK